MKTVVANGQKIVGPIPKYFVGPKGSKRGDMFWNKTLQQTAGQPKKPMIHVCIGNKKDFGLGFTCLHLHSFGHN